MPEIAWGKKVSAAFKSKILTICTNLGCDPSHLMSAIAFETGETFSPSIQNPSTLATGLIQFIKPTATALGTTLGELKAMTDIEQLDYVAAYFKPYKNKMSTVSDVYMAILWPAAIGKPEAKVLFAAPSKTYEQNKGLDFDKDGTVTKAEAAAKVFKKLAEGMKDGVRG